MMNKLLDKLMGLFKEKESKKTEVVQPKPKVKRQNAVPTLKDNVENKAHKEMPKKQAVDRKVTEAKKKNEDTKASDIKPKKKYHRYKNFKNKKPSSAKAPGNKTENGNKEKI